MNSLCRGGLPHAPQPSVYARRAVFVTHQRHGAGHDAQAAGLAVVLSQIRRQYARHRKRQRDVALSEAALAAQQRDLANRQHRVGVLAVRVAPQHRRRFGFILPGRQGCHTRPVDVHGLLFCGLPGRLVYSPPPVVRRAVRRAPAV